MEFNEENQKKVPRARKANFSVMEESILQREVENNFDVLRKINAL
jgi:L-lysine 2,3-aminomutase